MVRKRGGDGEEGSNHTVASMNLHGMISGGLVERQ